jgi:AraC-like DNA-binding protein
MTTKRETMASVMRAERRLDRVIDQINNLTSELETFLSTLSPNADMSPKQLKKLNDLTDELNLKFEVYPHRFAALKRLWPVLRSNDKPVREG